MTYICYYCGNQISKENVTAIIGAYDAYTKACACNACYLKLFLKYNPKGDNEPADEKKTELFENWIYNYLATSKSNEDTYKELVKALNIKLDDEYKEKKDNPQKEKDKSVNTQNNHGSINENGNKIDNKFLPCIGFFDEFTSSDFPNIANIIMFAPENIEKPKRKKTQRKKNNTKKGDNTEGE